MAAAAPFLVIFAVGGAIAITFLAFWQQVVGFAATLIEPYRVGLDRAAMPIKSEELGFAMLALTAVPWGIATALLRPVPLVGAAYLVIAFCLAIFFVRTYINLRVGRRLNEFNNQLEMVLRLIASAMRVGLGLRQALVNVISDMPDPARMEFTRLLTQTQIGVSMYDALDQLAARMPSSEIEMLARAVRMQSQTGGKLSRVLETLADTIKQRRRIARKIRALTAEAVMSKYIITALPVFVGGFVMLVEPEMRDGLLFTSVGRVILMIVAGLIGLGWYLFGLISRLDI